MNVGLAAFHGQALVEEIADQKAVDGAGIDARDADIAAAAHRCQALMESDVAALDLEVVHRRQFAAVPLGLVAHGIDHRIHATVAVGHLDDRFGHIVDLIEIERFDAVGLLGEVEAIALIVDHEDPLGALHSGAGRRQQPHRTGTEDRHTRAGRDAGVQHRLIGGRQDVGQE